MLADRLAAAVAFRRLLARPDLLPVHVVRSLGDSIGHRCLLSDTSSSVAVHPTPVERSRPFLGAIAALVGLVWALQGLGAPIGGSFMIGDPVWILAGVALIVAAGAWMAWPRLRRP
jgi:hypothetical protein